MPLIILSAIISWGFAIAVRIYLHEELNYYYLGKGIWVMNPEGSTFKVNPRRRILTACIILSVIPRINLITIPVALFISAKAMLEHYDIIPIKYKNGS